MSVKTTVVKAILPVVVDMLVDVVKDMVTPEGVVEFRGEVIKLIEDLVGKTETELDDNILRYFVESAFTLDNYQEVGSRVLVTAKEYVRNSETKYDDWVIPILDSLLEAFSVEKV